MTNKSPNKFVVRYRLPYLHEVEVGIEAPNAHIAKQRARRLFDAATLWDDTERVPLLRDAFDEEEARGAPLVFEAEAVEQWPAPDASVLDIRRRAHAREACERLVAAYDEGLRRGGSVDWSDLDAAAQSAREALATQPRWPGAPTGWSTDLPKVLVVVRGGVAETFIAGDVETAIVDLDHVAAGEPLRVPEDFRALAAEADLLRERIERPRSVA